MGTCYFLIRRDTMTGYDLGKAWELCRAFAPHQAVTGGQYEETFVVTTSDVDTLAELMALASSGDLEIADVHRRPPDPEQLAYWRLVALDIVDWSEGQPFEFHSEHSGLYEDLTMDGWEDDLQRIWETGDRHNAPDGRVPPREILAARRKIDENFRRGNVWRDHKTGEEIIRTRPA